MNAALTEGRVEGRRGLARLELIGLGSFLLLGAAATWAQPDYAAALWNPAYPGHWYTSGNSHSFCVIHDMESYYLSVISYFQQSGTQASAHYCVNSDYYDGGGGNDGVPGGQITQMVREQDWAWHALCWNRFSLLITPRPTRLRSSTGSLSHRERRLRRVGIGGSNQVELGVLAASGLNLFSPSAFHWL